MKNGRFICDQLKKIRLDIARANGIKYMPRECHHEGECLGTCPACESEVRFLEREIARKRTLGKAALVAGVSLGLTSFTATSCDYVSQAVNSVIRNGDKIDEPLEGEVMVRNIEVDSIIAERYTLHSDKGVLNNDSMEDERKAVFPGGKGALLNFIKKNFVCPKGLPDDTFTIVEIVIDSEGNIEDEPYVSVMADSAFIAEALRVTNMLPQFEPAKQEDGTPFMSRYFILFDAKRLKAQPSKPNTNAKSKAKSKIKSKKLKSRK